MIIESSMIWEHSWDIGWKILRSIPFDFLVGYVSLYPDLSFFSWIAIDPIYIPSLMIALAKATMPSDDCMGKIRILSMENFIFLKWFLSLVFLDKYLKESNKISELCSSFCCYDSFFRSHREDTKKVRCNDLTFHTSIFFNWIRLFFECFRLFFDSNFRSELNVSVFYLEKSSNSSEFCNLLIQKIYSIITQTLFLLRNRFGS